jgi:hypothetical protein
MLTYWLFRGWDEGDVRDVEGEGGDWCGDALNSDVRRRRGCNNLTVAGGVARRWRVGKQRVT